jgi:hypothetical protein
VADVQTMGRPLGGLPSGNKMYGIVIEAASRLMEHRNAVNGRRGTSASWTFTSGFSMVSSSHRNGAVGSCASGTLWARREADDGGRVCVTQAILGTSSFNMAVPRVPDGQSPSLKRSSNILERNCKYMLLGDRPQDNLGKPRMAWGKSDPHNSMIAAPVLGGLQGAQ